MQYLALVGTNSVEGSKGIYTVTFSDEKDMQITSTVDALNAGFLAVRADKKYVYATRENMIFRTHACGGIGAYSIGPDGVLSFVNEQDVAGQLPCYVSVDSAGKYVFVASYLNGCVSIHKISPDGSVGPVFKVLQHSYAFGIHPSVHCVAVTPDQKYICVLDVTVHRIVFYDLAQESFAHVFTLQLPGPYDYRPRQVAFSADHAYILTETGHGLLTFRYSPEDTGHLLVQEQSFDLTPADYVGKTTGACIKLSPNGKMLLCSVRRAHLLTIFKVAPDGTLSDESHLQLHGKCPRDFSFTPDGQFVLLCMQQTNSLELYRVNYETNTLYDCRTLDGIPNSTCVKFL